METSTSSRALALPASETGAVTGDPLKADFRNFLVAMWRFLGLPKPTPLQLDIAYHLQHGPKRDIIQAFRGAAKSWITAAYVLWRLYCDPQLLILVVSASGNRAAKFTRFCLDIIMRWERLRHLRPKPNQRQSSLGFDVGPAEDRPDQQPSMEAKGITGQITGGRADVIVADDVEVPRNSDTETKREKLREQIREFDAILRPDNADAVIKYLGTPQTESSIYSTLSTRGYATRIWPILFPDPSKLDTIWGSQLAPSVRNAVIRRPELAGKTVEPTRFSNEDIAVRRLSYGSIGFALQFMLDTRAGDANRFPLKLNDLVVTSCGDPEKGPESLAWAGSKEYAIEDLEHFGMEGDRLHKPAFLSDHWVPWQFSLMAIDPSGRGSDETAYCILRFLNGRLFLTSFGGIAGGYDEAVLEKLGKIAAVNRVNLIVVEDNFGQGMFAQLLKPHVHCTVETERVTTQKERRIISALEPVISGHRLVVDREALEKDHEVFSLDVNEDREEAVGEEGKRYYSLTYQLSRITFEKNSLPHDDRIDVLGLAVKYYEDRLDLATGTLEIASEERRIEFEIEEFLYGIFEGTREGLPNTGHIVICQMPGNPNILNRNR